MASLLEQYVQSSQAAGLHQPAMRVSQRTLSQVGTVVESRDRDGVEEGRRDGY